MDARNSGNCRYCENTYTMEDMLGHLQRCPQRAEVIAMAEARGPSDLMLWHLVVQDVYDPAYWLHLEMRGASTLTTLDRYLRAIWLECCGHLSEFSTGARRAVRVAKSRQADQVLRPRLVLFHFYDFGTPSGTELRVVGVRLGAAITRRPIELMARNAPPAYPCPTCGQPSVWMCWDCIEVGEDAFWCDNHGPAHRHDEDEGTLVRIVNSPRLGMCGYDGPATPPY